MELFVKHLNIPNKFGRYSWSYGVMAITQDFESCNPSSSLGRTLTFLVLFKLCNDLTFFADLVILPFEHISADKSGQQVN